MPGNPKIHPDVITGWCQLQTPERSIEIFPIDAQGASCRDEVVIKRIVKKKIDAYHCNNNFKLLLHFTVQIRYIFRLFDFLLLYLSFFAYTCTFLWCYLSAFWDFKVSLLAILTLWSGFSSCMGILMGQVFVLLLSSVRSIH